ncbi:hypothetical protein HDV57DRAFT_83843 [Trichoderma longibrachiatum]|uniref:Uncharacterized protein n=1 Tax=Trichoderma longibrachiatum ATCC 18648 TaxID=983965 RepID=A0A2T4CEM4_TRILO|nr:hypothetical protein M440DRAFT_16359 [Trichoderma longibrachiatum ATCC 18648]
MAATVGSRLLAPWVGEQNPPPSPLASNPVVFRRYSTGIDLLEGSSKKNRRSSVIDPAMALRNLKNSYISKVHGGGGGGGVDDDDELEDEQSRHPTKRYSRDDTTTLAEFLKTHEPPSTSFMSVPFGHADDKDQESKWSKFKALKKRSKSVPRPPQNIQLPDSAVSGLTIGGHRHIAISIPLEAMPFNSDPNSTPQCPANAGNQANKDNEAGQRNEHNTLPRNYVVQTYSEENGTVTVLPAAATNEVRVRSKAPPAHRFSLFPPQSASLSPTSLPQRCSLPPTPTLSHDRSYNQPPGMPTDEYMGSSSRSKRDSKHSSYSTISPKRIDPPTPTHIALYAQGTAAWGAGAAQSPPQSPAKTRTQRPTRASSMVITTTGQKHPHPALSPSIDGRLSVANGVELVRDGYNKKPLPKPPAVSDPRAKQKRKSSVGYPSPITEELTDGSLRSNRRSVRRAVSSQSMMAAEPEMPSRPSTAGSIQSRRDKVREKKRRDMEAVRNAKALKELQRRQSVDQYKDHEGGGQGHDASGSVQQPLRDAKAQKEDGRPQMSSISTLCPVVVVVDLQPSPGLPDDRSAQKASPPPSPLPLPSPLPDKDQMRMSRDIDSELYLQQKRNMMDEQILRLYDSYHENRLRDVERRIRRLERNGDVWLRALVPVLDDMSRNLKTIQPSSRVNRDADATGDGRGWASDDEVTGASAERKARSIKRAKTPTRRASLSRGRIMAGLIGRRLASDDSGSDSMSRSDEVGGLGIIEPLMRELAGEARRRQQQLAERTADDWRHNTV